LGRVRDDVLGMTGGRQEPFIYGSLGGSTMALVPQPSPAKMIEPPPPPQQVAKPAVAHMPSPPVVVATRPKPVAPVAAQPNPAANTPVVAKAEIPKGPELLAAREAVDPATACARDEQRLARLRSEPSRDQIVNFQKELSCGRLRSQVQRLLESMMPDALQQAAPITAAPEPPKPQMQAQARPMSADEVCSRDAARVMQLRADPSAEAIAKFDRELGCERIRPQLQRLRESMGQ
jgi:hypothetical protein